MLMTRRSSVISLTVRVWGTLTSIPDCSTGAVTMKIDQQRRTTSTSGVMLISAREVCVRPLGAVKAITAAPPEFPRPRSRLLALDGVQHFQGKVIATRRKVADGASDQVVGNHCWNRRRQSGGGRDQGLRRCPGDRAVSVAPPAVPRP